MDLAYMVPVLRSCEPPCEVSYPKTLYRQPIDFDEEKLAKPKKKEDVCETSKKTDEAVVKIEPGEEVKVLSTVADDRREAVIKAVEKNLSVLLGPYASYGLWR